jgi:hypothetical protein
MTKYTLRLDTPRKHDAGTNADVEGRIVGSLGSTGWHILDNPGDDREQGSKDYYRFEDVEVGTIITLELRVTRSDADKPSWLLEAAYIAKVEPLEMVYLPFNEWINPQSRPSNFRLAQIGWLRTIDPGFLGTPNAFLW